IAAIAIIALVIFLKLVAVSVKLKSELARLEVLLSINREEISVLNGHYNHRPNGAQLQPAHHPYSQDLDVFGHASLFQYLHRTTSEQSAQLLANWLLQPADKETILARQQAAKELRDQSEWRQELQARGHLNPLSYSTQHSLAAWLSQPAGFANTAWKIARFILPAISLTLLVLYTFDLILPGYFWLGVLIFFAVSGYISKLATPQYVQLSKHITQLETLSKTLQWIENASFTSPLLTQLKHSLNTNIENANADNAQRIRNPKHQTRNLPSQHVKSLKRILDRMDYRLNPLVFVPLNIFLFWDLQQVLQLEKWKAQQQNKIDHWFEAIAEAEAISSLANLSFNHPSWVFPVIRPEWFALKCEQAGHPLIPPAKCVPNSIGMNGHPQLAFITGSNMAGKSTFLRTIGINLVMAMAGAPVCGAYFESPVLRVMTSMRIADNLEESASTFYAELQKLKMILDAVKTNSKEVFLLLDEILRGTNSLDRHTGSEALIKQLIKEKAVGMIASHDLSLAELEQQYPGIIHNYHFDVTIEGNELHFDYKLKQGVCKTLNATLLMKKIGIEM
ncbi:MAG: hypothetical protein WCF67_03510, partial [Chitinophagaceae bacterium]